MTEISKQTGCFTSFDGTTIYYEVRGSGRPVFLCYGLACLINHWTHQLKFFSRNYRTIVFDYRGHHNSSTPANRDNLSTDAICMDLKGLADHLGVAKASFWGHSYGVQVLLRYYDMFPETVENMVFINGFASNPLSQVIGPNATATLFKIFKEGYHAFPETIRLLWRKTVTNPLAIPISSLFGGFNMSLTSLKDIEVYAQGVSTMDLDVFIAFFDKMINYDATPVLERIEVPVLIISGNKDGVTPPVHQEKLHQKIRGSQIMRVPYGSHCTQLDLPEFVNLRIEKFLEEVGYVEPTRGES